MSSIHLKKSQGSILVFLLGMFAINSYGQSQKVELPPLADTDYIHKKVEQMPVWPGCNQEQYTERDKSKCTDSYIREYIAENLVYPKLAYDNRREGMCVVTFNIRKNGMIGEIRCARDIGLGCGEAATDVFHKMNADGIVFTPGYEAGEAQVVSYTFPVSFRTRVYDANRRTTKK